MVNLFHARCKTNFKVRILKIGFLIQIRCQDSPFPFVRLFAPILTIYLSQSQPQQSARTHTHICKPVHTLSPLENRESTRYFLLSRSSRDCDLCLLLFFPLSIPFFPRARALYFPRPCVRLYTSFGGSSGLFNADLCRRISRSF